VAVDLKKLSVLPDVPWHERQMADATLGSRYHKGRCVFVDLVDGRDTLESFADERAWFATEAATMRHRSDWTGRADALVGERVRGEARPGHSDGGSRAIGRGDALAGEIPWR